MYLLRDRLVDVKARRDENQLRALTQSGDGRHGRVNAELSRRIAGGGDHAALTPAAHGQRHTSQAWGVALLHRSIERVHIDVDDAAPV